MLEDDFFVHCKKTFDKNALTLAESLDLLTSVYLDLVYVINFYERDVRFRYQPNKAQSSVSMNKAITSKGKGLECPPPPPPTPLLYSFGTAVCLYSCDGSVV